MNSAERIVFEAAIKHFGPEHQERKLLEEMSELQKEICKFWDGEQNLDRIADEMADVEIVLDQMKLIFQNGGLVQQHREYKVDRLMRTLAKGEME